jgi:hypothetical protein
MCDFTVRFRDAFSRSTQDKPMFIRQRQARRVQKHYSKYDVNTELKVFKHSGAIC